MSDRFPSARSVCRGLAIPEACLYRIIGILTLALAFFLTGPYFAFAQTSSPARLQRVVAMVGARSGASWPLWLAKDGGYYQKHGLDVELVYAVHPAPMAAVISGQAVMTSTGADLGLLAAFRDPSLTLNGSFLNKGTF